MENSISVVDMKRHHCGIMARKIRKEQLHPTIQDNGGIHQIIVNHFKKSDFGKSIFFNGELIAMGGIQKSFLEQDSFVWLSISDKLRNLKFAVILQTIRAIKKYIKNEKHILSIINTTDETSVKFAKFFGFYKVNNEENKGDFVIMKLYK